MLTVIISFARLLDASLELSEMTSKTHGRHWHTVALFYGLIHAFHLLCRMLSVDLLDVPCLSLCCLLLCLLIPSQTLSDAQRFDFFSNAEQGWVTYVAAEHQHDAGV